MSCCRCCWKWIESTSTICRFLHTSGFTRQKLCLVAKQRDEFIRQQSVLNVSVYRPEMLIFLDETGADRRNMLRKYGYSVRGIPLKHQTLLVRGERVSAVAFMPVSGLLDVKVAKGTTDGDTFYNFVEEYLLPHLHATVQCHQPTQYALLTG